MAKQTVVTKTMQAETRIPPFAFQDYPVDVYLRIYPHGTRYGLEILAVGQMLRRPIDMTPQDLAKLNERLQEEMYVIARNKEQELPREQELANLAKVGHVAFNKVFSHPDAQTAIGQLISFSQKVSIQVVSEDFFLPWELIYPATLDEPFSCYHFWGMNHLISRLIIQNACPGAFVSPEISFNNCPKLGMLTYSGLAGVAKKELKFFQELKKKKQLTLFLLRSLDPDNWQEEFREFKSFWENSLNLAHFACHAAYKSDSPSLSYILLSQEFSITLEDMDAYKIEMDGHPLIIMNACETGNLNPLYTSNFAAAFLKYGARGVVATECAVPDAFAADFAEQLYAHLLAGNPLGESLLAARRYFLQKYNNPSGLLYSMYAPPSIRLVKAGGSNE
ncbi:MAG: CHAT domain-containing protein [Xenococcaceae cyanobacterium]